MLKSTVLRILINLSKRRLRRSSAKIIGITGSIGKTTVKEAVFSALKKHYKTLSSEGNFNTEFGLPMSILQLKKIPKYKIGWVTLLIKAFLNTYLRRFPYEFIVLEYGVDAPGDMDVLVNIAQPHIAIFTRIAPAHMDKGQFKSLKAIWNEKQKLVGKMPNDGLVIYNADDPLQKTTFKHFDGCQAVACGAKGSSIVEADGIKESHKGLSFTVKCDEKSYEVDMPHIVGKYHASLACILFALHTRLPKIKAINVISTLNNFHLPPGRMNLIAGVRGSTIIDSSYNASPASMSVALKVLKNFSGRKVAALGQMNELGDFAMKSHEEVGREVAKIADVLITVGKLGRIYARTAIKHIKGKSLQIYSFDSSIEAGKFLKEFLKKGDVVLVKGSQNKIRMEILIKEIMKNPEKAATLLVRQGKKWLK